MTGKKCIDCSEYRQCKDNHTSWIFFIIGLIATVAIRAVTILINVNQVYAKISWYIGISGFFIFFMYKFRVNLARAKIIEKNALIGKMARKENLKEEDYDLIGAILCGISSNKERLNFMAIFVLSAVSLVLAVYLDFIR